MAEIGCRRRSLRAGHSSVAMISASLQAPQTWNRIKRKRVDDGFGWLAKCLMEGAARLGVMIGGTIGMGDSSRRNQSPGGYGWL